MANTENIEAKLCAYVDGELDPAGRAEIEAHLVANPQHRQLMVELMKQRELLGGLPRERAPEDLFEAMTNQLERSVLLDGDAAGGGGSGGAGAAHVAGRINPWPQVFAAAAVLVLAIGLAAVIYFVLPNQGQGPNYARVTPTPGPAPAARSATGDRDVTTPPGIAGDAGTQPMIVTRADTDRVEAKGGGMLETAAPPDLHAGQPATSPTAVAVVPSETIAPAAVAPPAAAAAPAPAPDPFANVAGNQAKMPSDPAVAVATNMFADAQLNEKLKTAPGVPDNSMLVVVNAGDPSAANRQIREYFDNNGIAFEPMPEPIELRENQTVLRSRLGDTRMSLKGGGEPPTEPPGTPAPSDVTAEATQQRAEEKELAKADASKQAPELDKSGVFGGSGQQSGVAPGSANAAAPPPAPADGALADSEQIRAARSAGAGAEPAQTKSKSGDSSPVAGKGAGAEPAGKAGDLAGNVGGFKDKDRSMKEMADQRDTQRRVAADEFAQPPYPSREQSQTATPELEQHQQRAQQVEQQPQLQQQPMKQQFAAQPQSQLFIARKLTKQQVVAMNTAISNGNRINNYNRNGGTITPTTLPTVDNLSFRTPSESPADAPMARMKKYEESARGYNLNAEPPTTTPVPNTDLGAGASAAPRSPGAKFGTAAGSASGLDTGTGVASPATTRPADALATMPSVEGATAAESPNADNRLRDSVAAATAPGAAPQATSAPATTQAAQSPADLDADDERVDVVILVQPEPPVAAQQAEPVAPPPAATSTAPASAPSPSAP